MQKTVLTDMNARLSAAGRAVVGAREALDVKREHRDRLIVEAVDAGMAQRAVAAAAGVSVARVSAVLLSSFGD